MSRSLYIFEGFDTVGKSTVLEQVYKLKGYRPDYSIFDRFDARNYSFLYALGQMDLFESFYDSCQLSKIPRELVYDRCAPSSYVYGQLYKSEGDQMPVDFETVGMFFKKACKIFDEVRIIHTSHFHWKSAKLIYQYNAENNQELEKYDIFSDFENYYSCYMEAQKLFLEVYDYITENFNVNLYHVNSGVTKSGKLKFLMVSESKVRKDIEDWTSCGRALFTE